MEYRLCGGTFFTLLTAARRPYSRKQLLVSGLKCSTNEPGMLLSLLRMLNPDHIPYNPDQLRNITSKYKNCTLATGADLPFNNSAYTAAYHTRVVDNFADPYAGMLEFCNAFLQMENEAVKQKLVRSLLELISLDHSIGEDVPFYCRPSSVTRESKADLISETNISLPGLLVGIWHFIVMERPDNTVGRKTVASLYEEKDDAHAVGCLRSDLGAAITQSLRITAEPVNVESSALILEQAIGDVSAFPQNALENYLSKLKEEYSKVKTLIYGETPHELYSFFICSDILMAPASASVNRTNLQPIRNPKPSDLFKHSPHLILTGDGGLGKSMMMRHFLLVSIEEYRESGTIPVFVQAKDYNGGSIIDFVCHQIESLWTGTKDEFISFMKQNRAFLLLDGLDEMKSALLDEFQISLRDFQREYLIRIIMSSRQYSNFISFRRFTIAALCPFSLDQAKQAVEKLDFRPDAPMIRQKFLQELDHLYITHRPFVERPLLLNIMLMTYEQFAEVPSQMHYFYEQAYLTLAKEHDANKEAYHRILKTGLNANELKDLISEFSALAYRDERYEFSETEIEFYFRRLKTLARLRHNGFSVDDFIFDLCYSLCLMYKDGPRYRFIHKSFLEYFTARYFAGQKDRLLYGIANIFENTHRKRPAGDMAFSMLYDMIPGRIRENVFLPWLRNLFKACDQADGYWTFLTLEYREIQYAVGETDMFPDTEPLSFIYNFIATEAGFIHDEIEGDSIPENDKEFLTKAYYLKWIETKGSKPTVTLYGVDRRDDAGMVVREKEAVGFFYEIDIAALRQNAHRHKALSAYLESRDCPFYREYLAARQYLEQLKNAAGFDSEDIFDQME